ncbi:pimeloyl-ACP methyl ester carboxylesterase [Mycobacterium frederiksbergense]|uniref:Pimeloyl-ACP methyl ester carboxylesterase n=1 Tax=Mycolicibacterium frederiksbergense TaxID=117567 RepID=A0ABT6L124_9MYCO|nr:alpha/beta fold hydrolase [Mycolicibacterium frederiksbergense]MDH6196649.1 pimeloyl-ACP methyl ester carboxylesterase [Mycolicibacterium frederiksbergense]
MCRLPSGSFAVGGTGEPLLHGATMAARVWDRLLPELTRHHTVIAPTMPGHSGTPATGANMTLDDLVDWVESVMDGNAVSTAHLAGNSLGGLVAMELARRGRASSVVAISPAGGWTPEGGAAVASAVATGRRVAERLRPVVPTAMRVPLLRQIAFGDVAQHGAHLSPEDAAGSLLDTAKSTLFEHFRDVAVAETVPA